MTQPPRFSDADVEHLDRVAVEAYAHAEQFVDDHPSCVSAAVAAVLADPRVADRLLPEGVETREQFAVDYVADGETHLMDMGVPFLSWDEAAKWADWLMRQGGYSSTRVLRRLIGPWLPVDTSTTPAEGGLSK